MSDAERLLELLNQYELKWNLTDHGYLIAPYDPKTINEYMNRVFPIKLWFKVTSPGILGIYDQEILDETPELEDHLYISPENINGILESFENEYFESEEHAATYTEVWTIIDWFKETLESAEVDEDQVVLTMEDPLMANAVKNEQWSPQLIEIIEVKDSSVIIPLQYVPLIVDHTTQTFPLYYPTSDTVHSKLSQYLESIDRRLRGNFHNNNVVSFGFGLRAKNIDEIYNKLVEVFGINNVSRSGHQIEVRNISQAYRNLWNQHVGELLESKYRHQLLLDRVGSVDLIPLVEDYLISQNPTYERVFGLPLRRRLELTRQLRPRVGTDLSRLIGQYEPPLLVPPEY